MKKKINIFGKVEGLNGKRLDTLKIILVFAFLVTASLASAIPLQHGIKGIVYLEDGTTQAPEGTHFSVEVITGGDRIEGTTGGPTEELSGFYSVSISGVDDDNVIIRAWNKNLDVSGTVKVALSGEMDGIDVVMKSPIFQCSDGIDNDGDGQIDLSDPGCNYAEDDDEKPQCNDGIDNDGDGKIDIDDAGCENIEDNDESNLPQCSDGIDNNRNGKIDLEDPSCENSRDDYELESTDIDCNGRLNWLDVVFFVKHYYWLEEGNYPENKRIYPCAT